LGIIAIHGFDFDAPGDVPLTPRPSQEDLVLLRTVVARRIAADYPDFAKRVWSGLN